MTGAPPGAERPRAPGAERAAASPARGIHEHQGEIVQLARRAQRRVTVENPLDERGSAARQADDEDRIVARCSLSFRGRRHARRVGLDDPVHGRDVFPDLVFDMPTPQLRAAPTADAPTRQQPWLMLAVIGGAAAIYATNLLLGAH